MPIQWDPPMALHDFQRFQMQHSWYKHLPLEGVTFYAYRALGEQPRNGMDTLIHDPSVLHWHFSGRCPENVPSYPFQVGPFLQGAHGEGNSRSAFSFNIIRDIAGNSFLPWISNHYPEWNDVSWPALDYLFSHPIIIELFERETSKYWYSFMSSISRI